MDPPEVSRRVWALRFLAVMAPPEVSISTSVASGTSMTNLVFPLALNHFVKLPFLSTLTSTSPGRSSNLMSYIESKSSRSEVMTTRAPEPEPPTISTLPASVSRMNFPPDWSSSSRSIRVSARAGNPSVRISAKVAATTTHFRSRMVFLSFDLFAGTAQGRRPCLVPVVTC